MAEIDDSGQHVRRFKALLVWRRLTVQGGGDSEDGTLCSGAEASEATTAAAKVASSAATVSVGVGRARRQAVAGSMARSTRRDDERGVNVGRADDGELGGAIGGSGDDGGTRAKNVQLRSMTEKNGRCEQMQNYGMVDMRLSGCRIGSGCIEIGGERREKRHVQQNVRREGN